MPTGVILSPLSPLVVDIGLIPLNYSVSENETFPVCVAITNGTLGCNLTVYLGVESGTAVGEAKNEWLLLQFG